MAKKISVSFKETTRDQKLLSIIMAMEDKSYEIKKILYAILIDDDEPRYKIDYNHKSIETPKEENSDGPSLDNLTNF